MDSLRAVGVVLVCCLSACGSDNSSRLARSGDSAQADLESNERFITRAGYGERWPYTVDSGVLSCNAAGRPRLAVVFRSGGTTYAVNGQAKMLGHQPDESIRRTKRLGFAPDASAPTDEAERQRIYKALVACEDHGSTAAACRGQAATMAKLSTPQIAAIANEGTDKGWPPLPPHLIDVTPLIQDGLKLCG